MSMSDFLSLSAGDVVGLGVDEDDDIDVLVEGVPKLRGRPGSRNGSLTVTVTEGLRRPQAEEEEPAPESASKIEETMADSGGEALRATAAP